MHHVMHDKGLPQPQLVANIDLQFLAVKVGTRMSGFDWRSVNSYGRAQDAEMTGFAWECLRRNPEYQRDLRSISPTSAVSAEFRQRWGLCFRS
jgi:hypothetical protein